MIEFMGSISLEFMLSISHRVHIVTTFGVWVEPRFAVYIADVATHVVHGSCFLIVCVQF